MDAYSSGEELLVKTRKPYTITKQRERWTDEEHNRFLEALKLYGRAWQRIEEHIGTKTAVQIRSHAQKFFSKLEKEALVKGVPIGEAIDIEIPPPRPKRKPSNPYPRKTGTVSSPNSEAGAKDEKHSAKQVGSDLDKEPPIEKNGDVEEQNPKGTCGGDRGSEVITHFQGGLSSSGTPTEVPATAPDSAKKLPNLNFVPVKLVANEERSESHVDNGHNTYHKLNNNHSSKSFPRHAPVQILNGSQGTLSQGISSSQVSYQEPRLQTEIPGHSTLFSYPTVSGASESQNCTSRSNNHKMHPGFHTLFNHFPNNEEDYTSFLQTSSSFASLIVSSLLQNPAAHAAACFAASLWPSPNTGNSTNTPPHHNGGFAYQVPSMEAIAGATVAAATAWWAAHGLLPLSVPFHSASVPSIMSNEEKKGSKSQISGPQDQKESKYSETSSSDSGNSGEKMEIEVVAPNTGEAPSTSEQIDVSKGKNKKQVDRSSCGSNTPSGSDVETDALVKNDLVDEEAKVPDGNNNNNNNSSELNGRRLRIVGNTTDSWKEVSDEGRLAFTALFSRGKLPQSFSPPQMISSKVLEISNSMQDRRQITENSNEKVTQLDLNTHAWESMSSDQTIEKTAAIGQDNVNGNDGVLRIGLPLGKPTSNKVGFKPYKRCSVEAKESGMNSSSPEQGNCPKRIRLELEGEASL